MVALPIVEFLLFIGIAFLVGFIIVKVVPEQYHPRHKFCEEDKDEK